MEKKFTIIDVGGKNFKEGDSIEKNFSNDFGLWQIFAKRTGNNFIGTISFKAVNYDLDLSKIKPNVLLTKASSSFDDINRTYMSSATKIPVQSCFLFSVCCGGFRENRGVTDIYIDDYGYNSGVSTCYYFSLKVEIDLTQASIKSVLPTTNSSTINHLHEMYETGKLADVKIIADGKEIKAHNLILSRSSIFHAMLNVHDTKEAQEKVIKIEDIEYEVLVEMLRFMYTDQVPKIKKMACALLVAANKYDLPGLANACGNYLIANVDVESFADVLEVAYKFDLQQLKISANKFFSANRKKIIASEGWNELKRKEKDIVIEFFELVNNC